MRKHREEEKSKTISDRLGKRDPRLVKMSLTKKWVAEALQRTKGLSEHLGGERENPNNKQTGRHVDTKWGGPILG